MSTVAVVAGGDPIEPDDIADIRDGIYVVAADSGLDRALEVGLVPDLLVGDLDSAGEEAIAAHAGPVERHPVDKDATDLELALAAARRRNPDRIVVVGGGGGRLDHLIGNALALATVDDTAVEWRPGGATVHVVGGSIRLHAPVGTTVSLIPVAGPVRVASTTGLRWSLTDETLPLGSTRGVSNRTTTTDFGIDLSDGVLLVILPRQS